MEIKKETKLYNILLEIFKEKHPIKEDIIKICKINLQCSSSRYGGQIVTGVVEYLVVYNNSNPKPIPNPKSFFFKPNKRRIKKFTKKLLLFILQILWNIC